MGVLGTQPRSTACRSNTIPAVLLLQALLISFYSEGALSCPILCEVSRNWQHLLVGRGSLDSLKQSCREIAPELRASGE